MKHITRQNEKMMCDDCFGKFPSSFLTEQRWYAKCSDMLAGNANCEIRTVCIACAREHEEAAEKGFH